MLFLQKCFARSSVAATGRLSDIRAGTEGSVSTQTRSAQTVLRAANLPSRRYVSLLILIVAALPRLASAQVVISEIMYDAPGSDSKAEWIELQNTGDTPVDIAKWKLNDGSNHVLNAPPKNGSTGTTVIAPGDFLILAADATTFESSHAVNVSVLDTVMDLSNDKGSISLLNASSSVEDKVSYTSSRGGSGTGESLQKVNGKLVAAVPTPGAINSTARILKPAPVAKSAKTSSRSSKRVATKAKPEILDGTSTVSSDIADAQESSSSSPMVAAAVVPLSDSGSSFMPWAYGVLGLGVTGAAAVLVARQKKKGEWDIEEIA